MEALTVLLIGITSTLGFIAFSVGVFFVGTDQNRPAARQRRATAKQPQSHPSDVATVL
jgi:hypothetical protein